ncbi:MAG: UDP-3-O-acyl-N-acetylglucosamine deacetylase [Planctomycetaceae bacterium]|nr:UDP-3-O-acyl-N-acetylglucosamine deacetylase [Planctomycetaceae bacterium]
MQQRHQQTISRPAQVCGYGLFTNAEVKVNFLPAAENHGIVFQRTDLPGQPTVPALSDWIAPEERRTKLVRGEASVEMIEHAMAALAGLQIDNCLVQVNGPELPGCDGSSLPYAAALLDGEPVLQNALREVQIIRQFHQLELESAELEIKPATDALRIRYELDYGEGSVIPCQSAEFEITPEIFVTKIASARTFVLEQEIAYLRSRGYGQHVTAGDLLVYGPHGPVGSELRARNECARHKLLDCLGDLALCGCDVIGSVRACRSGHRHNHALARYVRSLKQSESGPVARVA